MNQAAGEPVVQPGRGLGQSDRGDEGQNRPDRASGEYVSGSASAADRERRDQPPGSDTADRNQERDLLDRERSLLERERDLLERERELAEQEGSVRPRLRRHDPGNRS